MSIKYLVIFVYNYKKHGDSYDFMKLSGVSNKNNFRPNFKRFEKR